MRKRGDHRIANDAVVDDRRAQKSVTARDAPPFASSGSDNSKAMTDDRISDVLSDRERAIAQRFTDEIGEFNLKATGIAEFHELLTVETDRDGELLAGVYGWSWGGTCWIEALWVRGGMRHRRVGSRLWLWPRSTHDVMVVRSSL
jgi:hypothetical protein